MRLLLFSLLLIVCGCKTVVIPNTFYVDENLSITVMAVSHLELQVSYVKYSPQFRFLPEEFSLTGSQGHKYQLEFLPIGVMKDDRRPPIVYRIRAFGPLPASSQHTFEHGPYTLSVAYMRDGERHTSEKTIRLWKKELPRLVPNFHWPLYDL